MKQQHNRVTQQQQQQQASNGTQLLPLDRSMQLRHP
jgi:hypothetical protein